MGTAGVSEVDAQGIVLGEANEATLGMRAFKWKHSFALFVYGLLLLAVTVTIQDFPFRDSIPLQHSRLSAVPLSSFNYVKVTFHLT